MVTDKNLEDLDEKFNSLTRKRMQAIIDLDKMTKELVELAEKVYEASPEYVKIDCLQCGSKGTVQNEDKLMKCPVCNMKGYLWAKKFKGEEKQDGN